MLRRSLAGFCRKLAQWSACALLAVASMPCGYGQAPAPAEPNRPAITSPKSVAEMRAMEEKIKALVPKLLPAVVGVEIGNARGSGVIVSEDGLVMTAGHVVGKPGQKVTFFFADGKTGKGTTLGAYHDADAGLMKITDAGKWPFVAKAPSAKAEVGNWCLAVGHPLGYQEGRPPVVRLGRVLRLQDDLVQTDCALVGGDSGGPLFDLEGRVIGINSKIGPALNINFHVTVDVFGKHWERLLRSEDWHDLLVGRESNEIRNALRPLAAEAAACLVRVRCDGQDAALGTVVGPDGWILTKASELKGKVACQLQDGRTLDARTVGVLDAFDLAMLKIDATDLPILPWSSTSLTVGQWLASPCFGDAPVAMGVLSVPQRKIPFMSGIMGITLKMDEPQRPAEIEKIFPKTPAEKAGLKERDVVTHLDGKAVKNSAELVASIRQRRPGVIVRLNVKRGQQVLAIPVKLAALEGGGISRREDPNHSGLGVSQRHDDFPAILQHDVVVRPVDCGGPLIDLTGKVVGVNIARGGRTETYSIPSQVVLEKIYALMSGELNPERVAAAKAAAEKAAADKLAAAEKAAAEKAAAEKAAAEKAAAEKLAAEKAALEKAVAEKSAAEKAAAEKLAAEKAAAEKLAAEKAALEKAAAEKAAAEKAAAEKAAQDHRPTDNPTPPVPPKPEEPPKGSP